MIKTALAEGVGHQIPEPLTRSPPASTTTAATTASITLGVTPARMPEPF